MKEVVINEVKDIIIRLKKKGAKIAEVEVDPEIEAQEVIAITVWMRLVSSEEASSFWTSLIGRISQVRSTLNKDERDKLDRWVSVAVDIE